MKKLLLAATAAALLAGTWLAPAQAEYLKEHRGGTIRLLARSAAGTLDPHINYTDQGWQMYQPIYDGLVAFRKAEGMDGFTIVPDLAEALPQVSNDGKTFTFKLRKGIKFSSGQDLGVKDVVASFQRIFKVSGPTSGTFYAGIVGADKCLADTKSCTLEGGVVGDEAAGTITINITKPDAELLYKLALPHAVVLPADTPAEDMGSKPIPSTGAYMISAFDPNKGMTVSRNPNFKQWSEEAQPDGYPDVVQYDFGLSEEAAVTAIQNGEADWMFDALPSDRLGELGSKSMDQLHISPLSAWWYAPLNNRLAPFDNEKARQAVAYAIDRNTLVKLFGGKVLASPVCQVLPPDFPGHEDYCPFTKNPGAKWSAPDLDKAKQLVEDSGTKGQKVTIIVEDTAISRSIGVYLQSVLTSIGYVADVKPISSNIQFTYIQNTNNKVQMSVTQWYKDYPAASDFLNILFSCASFREGSDASINIAGFCDKEIDAKMQKALDLGVTDQKAADKMWAEIDRQVTDKAPAVGLFTPKRLDFVSKRLGNFKFNRQFNWMITQSWVQ
ncbi:ABC transporter substrate-binding protein [Mesorhizobium sp. M7A.F.Ca.CA.001.09.2.1]|jgi:peptide/nickel transport system substrate-binding protein|uniref:ABC transporter substrate-binding protein n=9 Tax=Mesorhizobium TaxID=68287 RepID=A0AB38T4Q5_9HYPH|nr:MULTISPECIES: ABC transporter substrate-binding protein [Mesorhizobium]RUV51636.1 ABC transporter substrate-binding protein [Mesorhizobium sp. M7A.F.Ca.MR.228.00.0.0]RUY39586.1 ABC transporter substrate-binding protein [Mesorhizobium sp. M7A.F.Ca.CA.001.13.2.1]RUZ90964.1 ABC transporter substrate-binding protein [Mesorhizobium sp. M7A.F.Ca.US.003.02.2.1]AMX92913.1 peptide ABC transporter substrate-binding protein [Mesorhizobium ciceri]AMY00431.1 peptide ABC transporter substrate-binding pro